MTGRAAIDRFTPFLGRYETTDHGEGVCPSGTRVTFREALTLTRVDDWVRYTQRAEHAATGVVLHEEHGVFRPSEEHGIELALVMNSGRLELGTAEWHVLPGARLVTHSESFFNDRLGVRANERRFTFEGEICHKELWLATATWPNLTRHMWGRLSRL